MFNGSFPKGKSKTLSSGNNGIEPGIFFGSTSKNFLYFRPLFKHHTR